jgi:hypothetical protein
MRRPVPLFAILLVLSTASLSRADGPLSSPPARVEATPPTFAEAVGVCQHHWIGGHLFIGFPIGLRLQGCVYQAPSRSYLVEGFAGGFWFGLGGVGLVGLGGRVNFTVFSDGCNDAFLIGPGLGVMAFEGGDVWSGDSSGVALPITVDFTRAHDFATHFGWELGLQVGAAPTLRNGDGGGTVIPIVSSFSGFKF